MNSSEPTTSTKKKVELHHLTLNLLTSPSYTHDTCPIKYRISRHKISHSPSTYLNLTTPTAPLTSLLSIDFTHHQPVTPRFQMAPTSYVTLINRTVQFIHPCMHNLLAPPTPIHVHTSLSDVLQFADTDDRYKVSEDVEGIMICKIARGTREDL